MNMEFLVEFELEVPRGEAASDAALGEVALAAERLADQGHLLRLWIVPNGSQGDNLPLQKWVNVVITKLEPHPNDPRR
jgi:muconolactone delta-isomerase